MECITKRLCFKKDSTDDDSGRFRLKIYEGYSDVVDNVKLVTYG